ncbi:TauD/TfdA family dioxygenase [Hydrogenophilus thiooxidans]|uniref:TauD/TfdA family dioxygenase n=1 Tax=Hydrogenophilus thiooxidans TaxID=2820326 RepID=UPI001C22AE72|nr:TauD/TfdA family dioxygenase [Hydrogenophilus thiooxidans]
MRRVDLIKRAFASPPDPRYSPTLWQRWWEEKSANYPVTPDELIVEITNPESPTPAERRAVCERIQRFGVAVYRFQPSLNRVASSSLKPYLLRFAGAFGLKRLDANLLADDDGITPITVHESGERARYIPYTNHPIQWHTDGYYNAPHRRVRSLVLHAVRPALSGGENRLFDPEMLYLLLGNENPDYLDALCAAETMNIPPGRDPDGYERDWSKGPVFFWEPYPEGVRLEMRYTARQRNVAWRDDATVAAARAAVTRTLNDPASPYCLKIRLEAGMGLIGHNILHTREPFVDAPEPEKRRLLFRGRFIDPLCALE